MNLNELAKEISKLEGGKINLPIAQIKEVLKCLGAILAELETSDALVVVARVINHKR